MKFVKKTETTRTNSGFRHLYLGQRVINFPLYKVWNGMRQRCYNPNVKCYHRYGGRGIKVCKKWRESFIAFYEWALLQGWEIGKSIDRINNNLNYCPSNCRLATPKQQARNRRNTKWVRWNGKNIPLSELCENLKLEYKTISTRLRDGWTLESAITTKKKISKLRTPEEKWIKTEFIYKCIRNKQYPVYKNINGNYSIRKTTPNGSQYDYRVNKLKHLFIRL